LQYLLLRIKQTDPRDAPKVGNPASWILVTVSRREKRVKGTVEDKRKEDGGERETWNGCTLTVFGTN